MSVPPAGYRLAEVGIATEAELRRLGAVAAYRRLRHWNKRLVTRNMLWGLHGALAGLAAGRIDAGTKARLLAEAGAC